MEKKSMVEKKDNVAKENRGDAGSTHRHSTNSHKSKRKNRKKRGARGFKIVLSKALLKNIAIIVLTVALLGVSLLLLLRLDEERMYGGLELPEIPEYEGKFVIVPKVYDSPVSLIHQTVRDSISADDFISEFERAKKSEELYDSHAAVVLTPGLYNMPFGSVDLKYRVEISERYDLSDARTYYFGINEEIAIGHLKTGCKYYYKVSLEQTDYSFSGSFVTADTPRLLGIDGVSNVRDIGGLKTADGKRIRQGLIYRGSELDGVVSSADKLTEAGKKLMLETLGVKYDMDLRSESVNPTGIKALGEGVARKYYNAPSYKDVFTAEGKARVKAIFRDLANINNYPLYVHGTKGIDRTGTICFLIEAMLGVSDEELRLDYELSVVSDGKIDENQFNAMVSALDAYAGRTTSERVVSYLLDCGVSEAEISAIKNILLVDEGSYNAE